MFISTEVVNSLALSSTINIIDGTDEDDILTGGSRTETSVLEKRYETDQIYPLSVESVDLRNQPNLEFGIVQNDLRVEFSTTVELTFVESVAGYRNTVGYYTVADDGSLQHTTVLSENVKSLRAGDTFSIDLNDDTGSDLGLFIIANGFRVNDSYNGVDFEAGETLFIYDLGGANERIARVTDDSADISLVHRDGTVETVIDGNIYHTTTQDGGDNLNADGQTHVVAGLLDSTTDDVLRVGFEDLYHLGDADFNDVVFDITFEDMTIVQTFTDDVINGFGGNDQITGGEGNDVLDGGDGIDTVNYSTSESGVRATLLRSVAEDDGFGNSDSIRNFENIIGSDFDDNLAGDNGDNIVDGGAGNDLVRGGDGNDTVIGGLGDDEVRGDTGDDILHGGEGNDLLVGGTGNDELNGDGGNDRLVGDLGDDILRGGTGNDRLDANGGNDQLFGGAGMDVLVGDDGEDILYGDEGDDDLVGGADNDTLDGGADNDTLDGGDGDDTLLGGDGIDALLGGNGSDTLFGGAGNDGIDAGAGDDFIFSSAGQDSYDGGDGIDGISFEAETAGVIANLMTKSAVDSEGFTESLNNIENLFGSSFDDTLYGSNIDNVLVGRDGNDVLRGFDGNDSLDGGDGDDELRGDDGDDILYGEAGNDILLGLNDNDTLNGGAGNDELHGHDGNDTLRGDDGDDLLFGGAGDDLLIGGLGADSHTGGAGNDIFGFTFLDITADRIEDFEQGIDQINISDVLFGFTESSDLDDFVVLDVINNNQADIMINTDGQGTDWTSLASIVGTDFTQPGAPPLHALPMFITDQSLL